MPISPRSHRPHAGLVFERGLTVTDDWVDDVESVDGSVKLAGTSIETVRALLRACGSRDPVATLKVGVSAELSAYHQRRLALVRAGNGSDRSSATLDARSLSTILADNSAFVSGLGIPHPIENGLAWHRTLGVPYLPGSGVKGLTLSYARDWHNWPDGTDEKVTTIRRIFGAEPENPRKDQHKRRGSVVFLDAVPTEPPTVGVDVMTPHGKGDGRPDDERGANGVKVKPIGFLSVRAMQLHFAVLPAPGALIGNNTAVDLDEAVADCDRAMDWLTRSLALLGAGAKTRSDYGRMRPV